MSSIIIRDAKREDMKPVIDMIVELATFEGYPDGVKITSKDLERDGFDSQSPKFVCMVAENTKNNQLIGYILGNFAYSSWSGYAMYVEDFYVKPELRGEKIGHRLFKEFCKIARDNGCSRIDWHVLVENKGAVKFYESHGAYNVCDDENRTCLRIVKSDILKIANSVD